MSSQELARAERVVRAVLENHYDKATNIYSSDLFTGEGISVSRLAIKPYDEIVDIFLIELDKPKRAVVGTGEISIGELQDIGLAHTDKPTKISVFPKPEKLNTAHAEVFQKISKGLAKKIIKKLDMKEIQHKSKRQNLLRLIVRWFKESYHCTLS